MIKKLMILYYYLEQKIIERFVLKDRKKLQKYQEKKLKKHIKFLNKNSYYYKDLTYEDLKEKNIKYMNKEEMLSNFNDINTVNVKLKDVLKLAVDSELNKKFDKKLSDISVGLSSGTSGNKGVFISCEKEQAKWAGKILCKTLYNGIFSNYKIAFFMRANNNLYESASSKNINIKFFHLLDDFDKNLKQLNDLKPDILIGQPSLLIEIAKAISSNKIEINPKKIISIAELLEKKDEQYLKEIFKANIDQIYQATEGFIASTCEKGNLHINEEIMIVDKMYLDEKRYHPVITDFTRRSQPIINYLLNDILIDDDFECGCNNKSRVLKKIEGRMDDVFRFETPTGNIMIYPDFIRNAIIKSSSDISDYQVIKENDNLIKVYLGYEENTKENKKYVLKSLNELFDLKLKSYNNVQIVFIDNIEYEMGKKLKRIINKKR
ncbi:MAG: hypothetical protein N4A54_05840 [Peptostreptococcaceae bacterium]|jgi:putative adenylate-forming enzyme|nr:hypothetical protein [Peptostreptococcaceae bacterium]